MVPMVKFRQRDAVLTQLLATKSDTNYKNKTQV